MGDQLVRRRQSPVMRGSGWQREGFRPSEHLRHHSNFASTTKPTGQNLILMLLGVIAKMPINFKNCASNRSWYLRSNCPVAIGLLPALAVSRLSSNSRPSGLRLTGCANPLALLWRKYKHDYVASIPRFRNQYGSTTLFSQVGSFPPYRNFW